MTATWLWTIGFNPYWVKAVQDILYNTTTADIGYISETNGTGWDWVCLPDPVTINTNDIYRLYLYAGSARISLDRIVVTDDPDGLPSEVTDGTERATAGSASPTGRSGLLLRWHR